MNASHATSFSFTVEDDLISLTSANSVLVAPKTYNHQPFSRDFGPKGANGRNIYPPTNFDEKRLAMNAQLDAYKELNSDLFNPFEHKLQQGFINTESELYEKEKRRQIQLIKKREQDLFDKAQQYTIVFNRDAKASSKNIQKTTGNSIVKEDGIPSIGDYYQKKFGNKGTLPNIDQKTEHQGRNGAQNEVILPKSADSSSKKPPVLRQSSFEIIKESKQRVQDEANGPRIVRSTEGWKKQNDNFVKKTQSNEPPKTMKNINFNRAHQRVERSEKEVPLRSPPVRQPIMKPPVKPFEKPPVKPKNNNLVKKAKYSEVYQGPDRNLVEILEQEIASCPTITFDDIAELDNAKAMLQEAVLLPRMMPQFFKGIRKAMKGALLFGPPGTGKTLLAKALATNNMFFNVHASSLASKWKGESQKMVRILFDMARYHAPSIIFFDEIDCIASKRSENEHQSARKVKTELLVQMDGVCTSEKEVFVLAATNRPWDLDEALRRRLQKRIYIPLPQKQGRRKMFEINLKELNIAKGINWERVVDLTKGCSGSDICVICRDAAYMPMRRRIAQVGGITRIADISQKDLLADQITEEDLLEAAKKVKPSVDGEYLKRYSAWMKDFGSS